MNTRTWSRHSYSSFSSKNWEEKIVLHYGQRAIIPVHIRASVSIHPCIREKAAFTKGRGLGFNFLICCTDPTRIWSVTSQKSPSFFFLEAWKIGHEGNFEMFSAQDLRNESRRRRRHFRHYQLPKPENPKSFQSGLWSLESSTRTFSKPTFLENIISYPPCPVPLF